MKYKLILLLLAYFAIVLWRLSSPASSNQKEVRIIGGIVPHHLYVADIIGDFFSNISAEKNVDTVFIVGPDHLELGTTNITYNPSFEDQSIYALLPFVRSTFVGATITPVVLKRATSMAEIDGLVDQLVSKGGKTMVIASIDFSHYLSSKQAMQNDRFLMDLIKARRYREILSLSSDYLDSPGSLVAILKYYDNRKGTNMVLLNNSNSGDRGNPYAPTTSYYSILLYGEN
jgi:predicted class III extradiol MEMO1 family dioxygenase